MAEHLLRVTATDNAVLCYLHLTPSVAKLYGINSCGGNTSIGVMLLQVLEALGASVEWYERVPQLSEDATANEKALTEENAKLRCRITHLLRALDDMEQKYEGGSK